MLICKNLYAAWRLLYVTFSLVPIIAGADKFFNFIVCWPMYLNPHFASMINMTPEQFMYGVGLVEIAAGLLVYFRPMLGGKVVATWLILVAINLISMGRYFDIAIRDVVMAIAALVLVLLTKELICEEYD